ncbi:MAG: aldose epimerase [Opitutaceae bacterium]|nr:aldose epimerase [Opitutaceae bacterium]|tara:strand:- start:9135 stop:10130 length:996 start_codon:yes stop_codon:yes gene_type:complete
MQESLNNISKVLAAKKFGLWLRGMLRKETGLGQELFKWEIGPSEFRMLPRQGARLMSWDLRLSGNQKRSVIFWPEEADQENIAYVHGGNPILFPFSARTFHKGTIKTWKSPDGEIREMPIHGFARTSKFEVVSVDDSSISMALNSTSETKICYPFDFEFLVTYRFDMLALEVEFKVSNLGEAKLPWSAGHHFYFSLPWHKQLLRENYRILLPGCKSVYQAEDGSLAPAEFKGGEASMDDSTLVGRMHFRLKENKIRFGLKSGEEDIVVVVSDAAKPLPEKTVVTWTESGDSPFYCIEPWMGPPNSPEHKTGLHWIEPGESDNFKIRISLEE